MEEVPKPRFQSHDLDLFRKHVCQTHVYQTGSIPLSKASMASDYLRIKFKCLLLPHSRSVLSTQADSLLPSLGTIEEIFAQTDPSAG